MGILEELEIELWKSESFVLVDYGDSGEFYRISKDLGVRILCESGSEDYLEPNLAESELLRECRIQEYLYDYEVSVPEPIGVDGFRIFNGLIVPGFFMQHIVGSRLDNLVGDKKKKAYDMARDEVEKARDLGVEPGEDWDYGGNSIKSYTDGKVYLIDFEKWRE